MNAYVGTTRSAFCRGCGDEFTYTHPTGRPRSFCSAQCRRRYERRQPQRRLTEHARYRGAPIVERFTPEEIFRRDDWTCHVCGEAVDPTLVGRGTNLSPTIDHLLPISRGGDHSRANVKLAHKGCNARRGCALPGGNGIRKVQGGCRR